MRTYKDAKAMAKSLRNFLAARSVLLSHSECLEIIAKEFGFADWNTLSAKLDLESHQPEQLSCSFCGKSQHEVRSLIEGGAATVESYRAFSSAINASRSPRRSLRAGLATPRTHKIQQTADGHMESVKVMF